MDKITTIDYKIEKLKQKKAKIQTQEAVLFMKEVEKIFKEGFSPDIALAVLSDWATATESKKKEWTTRSHSFRKLAIQNAQQKTKTHHSADLQKWKAKANPNG